MHVLVTNDDGPPNADTSPYVHYFIEELKKSTDWKVSIAVPNTQRSWIGKAHMIGQNLTASYIYPGKVGEKYEGPFYQRQSGKENDEWVLLDGTPASCTNVGINYLFNEKGPVDLVLSGPNFGRNSTALYITSSGTIGAAMEGALCGVKSIGLSFAYKDKTHNVEQIEKACEISVKLIQHLYNNWSEKAQLYSINVPLDLAPNYKILYTHILENTWKANFEPFENFENRKEVQEADFEDELAAVAAVGETNKIEHVENGEGPKNFLPTYELNSQGIKRDKRLTQFKWKPDFAAVRNSVIGSAEGNDGLVVDQGNISVTPLRAVFKDVEIQEKEISLI